MKKLICTLLLNFSAIAVMFSQTPIDSLKAKIEATKSDTVKIQLLNQLHDKLRLSDFNQAALIAKQSYQLSLAADWSKGIAETGRNLGIAYNLLGKYDSATLVLNNALEHSIIVQDSANIGYIYMTLGNIQYDQTNYDQALEHYFTCLDVYKKIDNYHGMSSAMIWIGIIYQYSKSDYPAAIKIYNEAIGYATLGKSTLNKGYIYGNLATIFNDQMVFDSAIFYYQKSNDIKQQFNDVRGLGNGFNNIGNVFYDKKELDSALYYYDKGLEIRTSLKDQTGIATSHANIGKIYLDLNLLTKAEDHLVKSIRISKEINFKEAWQQSAHFLSILYERKRDYESALTFYKEYKVVSDSIFNLASDQSISELQTKYETEKKEQEIKLLAAENALKDAEITNANNRFYASSGGAVFILILAFTLFNRYKHKQRALLAEEKARNQKLGFKSLIEGEEKERKRIAQELHDGLGQLLSSARLNVSAMEDNVSDVVTTQWKNSIKLIDDAVSEVRTISHNMMPNALISIGFEAALQEQVHIINNAGQVQVHTEMPDEKIELPEAEAIALYRVIQEILNNALKYAEAKNIWLKIDSSDGIHVSIKDDGKGFDTDLIQSSSGIGWRNIQSRIDILNGEMIVESQIGKGSEVALKVAI